MDKDRLTRLDILNLIESGRVTPEQGYRFIKELGTGTLNKDFGESPGPVTVSETVSRGRVFDIAIIGMSGRFAGAGDIHQFWHNLAAGKNSIIGIPKQRWNISLNNTHDKPGTLTEKREICKWGGFLEDIDRFDPLFFNISGTEAGLTDPQQRVFLEESWKALEDAGYAGKNISNTRCGVFAGACGSDYYIKLFQAGAQNEPLSFLGNISSILPARISYALNLRGPSLAVDTACSSSLAALHLGCQSILSGESDMVLAGGISIFTMPTFYILASQSGMLSGTGQCRTFDNAADGFVPGEGAGVVVLKPLAAALEDRDHIYGVIKGSNMNQDGKTNGITAPSTRSQSELELSVYRATGINPETINYIETHGTGTKLGDPIEIEALTSAFREYTAKKQFCPVGSVKTNIGHTVAAAGIASLIKVLLAFQYKKIPPSLNFQRENEHIPFKDTPFYVNTELEDWNTEPGIPRRAAVSSFGFSGTNVHMVIEEYLPDPGRDRVSIPLFTGPGKTAGQPQLLVLSAKTPEQLKDYAGKLKDFLQNQPQPPGFSLQDMAYTLQVGRESLEERLAFAASSIEQVIEMLTRYSREEAHIENLFRGNVLPAAGEANHPGVSGKEEPGADTSGNLVKTGDWKRLAQLWAAGMDLDWKLLYPDRQRLPRRISLPTYPFARERYWIPRPVKGSGTSPGISSNQVFHPLLHRVDPTLSLHRQGVVFRTILNREDPVLRDHRVHEQPVLPGVAYLEMAAAAGSVVSEGKQYQPRRVVWLRPLFVNNETRELQILVKKENLELTFQVQARQEDQWVTHASGELHPDDENIEPLLERISPKEIAGRCTHRYHKQDLYRHISQMGIGYGPCFQGVEEVWSNGTEILGKIALPRGSGGVETFAGYSLHPGLLDSALQCTAAAGSSAGSNRSAGMPFSLEALEMTAPLPGQGYAYITSSGPQRFHVTIADEQGRVCLKLRDITFRPLRQQDRISPGQFFYSPRWRACGPAAPPPGGSLLSNEKQTVLVIYPPGTLGLETALEQVHSRAGHDVVKIRLGTGTNLEKNSDWEIDTRDPGALDQCIEKLKDIHRVYFLGGITAETKDWEMCREHGVISLFRLIKSLLGRGFSQQTLHLAVVTNNSQAVISEETVLPFSASLSGFTRSMAKEFHHWQVCGIDISLEGIENGGTGKQEPLQTLVQSLISEMSRETGAIAAVRKGRRYEQVLEPVLLPPPAQTPFKHRGVYLVVGGGGGIGLELGHYLAKTAAARLVLVDRSPLDTRRQEKVSQIQDEGGQVLYLQADITDQAAMETAVKTAKEHFGQINGVIHSALILRDKTLISMDEATLRTVLAPKVAGSVVLHRVLKDEPLDFMLFFSSAQSFAGAAGQANYAAACTFKDAFAHYLDTREPYPVKIINWGYWGSVGIVKDREYHRRLTAGGIDSIEPEEGMAAVEQVLGGNVSRVMAMKAQPRVLRQLGVDPETIPSVLPALVSFVNSAPGLHPAARDLQELEQGLARVVELGHLLLLRAFQRMGVFARSGERYNRDTLPGHLEIIPRYNRLYDALLEILAKKGFLRCGADTIITLPLLDDPEVQRQIRTLEDTKKQVMEVSGTAADHTRLLWTCLEAYPDVLTGRKSYIEVMFPNGSMSLVEGIYRGSAVTDYYNRLTALAVKQYVRQRLENHPETRIHILEVGAGTGGTTAFILEALKPHAAHLRYWYTDISAGFTQQGGGTFGEKYPFMEFAVFDMEKGIRSQGFQPGTMDLVVGGNVVHAGKRIDHTLEHLKMLLKTNGMLVILEATQRQDFVTLTFGLTDGWWRFEDEAIRVPGSPLLSPDQWKETLESNGFRHIHLEGLPGRGPGQSGQHVILAESDGSVPMEPGGAMKDSDKVKQPPEESIEPGEAGETPETVESALSLPREQLEKAALDYVIRIFAGVLNIPASRFQSQATFERYGVDSLVGLSIIKRLETDFDKLPATLLFEHMTLLKLRDYFLFNHRQRLEEMFPAAVPRQDKRTPSPVQAKQEMPSKPISRLIEAGAADLGDISSTSDNPTPGSDIAIIGISGRYPLAKNVEEFWENLKQGRNCIRQIPKERWNWEDYTAAGYSKWGGFIDDIDLFDPLFFQVTPRDAETMDPQARLFLEIAWETIEDAGYTRRAFDGINRQVGVFVGVMNCNYEFLSGEMYGRGMVTGANSSYWSIANRVSYCFDFQGPSMAVDTACSSSLTAIHLACESLKQGECRVALAGGVNLVLHPIHYRRLCGLKMVTADQRCKSFGQGADGFVDGEGVGAVLLKPLDRAIADQDRIYGVIKGSALNADGKTSGFTVPNPNAQAAVIAAALQRARINPGSISYIEAHGTGTELGDPIEIVGLTNAFREYMPGTRFCAIGSSKSNIGHLESAAGIAALTKVLLQMKHRQLVPSLHSEKLNPKIDFETSPFYVQQELSQWCQPVLEEKGKKIRYPRLAGISAFGAGGANAHLVVREYIPPPPLPSQSAGAAPGPGTTRQVMVLSAKDEERLQEYARRIHDFLERALGFPGGPITSAAGSQPGQASSDVETELIDAVGEILRVDEKHINPNEDLESYGFDTVNFSQLARRISRVYDLDLTPAVFRGQASIRELVPGVVEAIQSRSSSSVDAAADQGDISPGFSLADLAYTLQVGREPMAERLAMVVSDLESAREKLSRYCRGKTEIQQVYCGGIGSHQVASVLSGARAGREFIRLLARDQEIDQLAQLWAAGMDVDWETLFYANHHRRPRRIALPTYPFARERCWIPEPAQPAGRVSPQQNQGKILPIPDAGEIRGDSFDRGEPVREPGEKTLTVGMIDYLKKMIGTHIKLDPGRLDPEAGFERYGLDSVLISEFNAALEKRLGKLPSTLFFTYKSIGAVARYLVESHGAAVRAFLTQGTAPGVTVSAPMTNRQRESIHQQVSPLHESTGEEKQEQWDENIAIIGLNGQYPGAGHTREFWENLKSGKDCITEIPGDRWDYRDYFDPRRGKTGKMYCKWGGFLEDVDKFDPFFFSISPAEARYMIPEERLFLQCVWSCLEDAGYTRPMLADSRSGDRRGDMGVFTGVTFNEYPLYGAANWQMGNILPVNSQIFSIANRVSYFLNLKGPSMVLDTACSSSLYALHLACESIKRKECRMAIAGGVNLSLHPNKYISYCANRLFSSDGRCRAFGDGGDGMVCAEGVGAVLLKSLKEALSDGDHIYAVIKGTAVNHDGKTHGYTVPNPVAQTEVIRAALEKARVHPRTISYLEAHGTGTSLGDPIEISGLTGAFSGYTEEKQYCPIGSVKSNIGHPEAAAGLAQLTKVLLQMKYKTLVPSLLHSERFNPDIDFENSPFYVQQTQEEWKQPVIKEGGRGTVYPRRAGISSFGVGGVNVHVILEEYPFSPGQAGEAGSPVSGTAAPSLTRDAGEKFQTRHWPPFIILLSTKTAKNLREYAGHLQRVLDENPVGNRESGDELTIADIAYTLQTGREAMDFRLAFVVDNLRQLREKLDVFLHQDSNGADSSEELKLKGVFVSRERIKKGETTMDPPIVPDPRESKETLAGQWVRGVDIDWQAFYIGTYPETGNKPRRISLPTYPFLKESYWTPAPPVQKVMESPALPPEPEPRGIVEEAPGALKKVTVEMVQEYLKPTVAEVLGFTPPDLPGIQQGFFDMGMESVQGMNLITQVSERFNLELDPTIIFDYPNIEEFARYLAENIPGQPMEQPPQAVPGVQEEPVRQIELPAQQEQPVTVEQTVRQETAAGTESQELSKDILYFRDPWIKHPGEEPAKESSTEKKKNRGPILIFDALTGPGTTQPAAPDPYTQLVTRVQRDSSEDVPVIRVKPGTGFRLLGDRRYEIDPGSREDYQSLVRDLVQRNMMPVNIILCGAQETFTPGIEDDALEALLKEGIYRVFFLTRALLEQKLKETVYFSYIYPEAGQDLQESHPLNAPLSAFGECLHLEHSSLLFRTVAIGEAPGEASAYWDRVLAELFFENDDTYTGVRFQGGQRYVRSLEELKPPASRPPVPLSLKENGVYLVTGGLDGLGSIFARYLNRKVRATLVLTGCCELTKEQKVEIRRLRALGSRVIYIKADVSKWNDVQQLVADTRKRYKGINGIFHCAGISRDAPVREKTREEIETVLAPKVSGTIYLDRATARDNLDLFVLFSSITAVSGKAGHCDYSYANRFMDHFAVLREALRVQNKRSGKTLSVNWPGWRDETVGSDKQTGEPAADIPGIDKLEETEGLEAFENVLALDAVRVGVIKGKTLESIKPFADAVVPGEGAAAVPDTPAAAEFPPDLDGLTIEELETMLENEVKLSRELLK